MYEFTPFKKTDILIYERYMKFERELIEREEYKTLSPNAMLLYTILADRLELSFKQIESNSKIQFYNAKGEMYVIFKREDIEEKMHIKRGALNTALEQLKECKLVKEARQGKNMPNIIYLGKLLGMIEKEKLGSVKNQQSGVLKNNNPECKNLAVHNSNNNIYKNNNSYYTPKVIERKNNYVGRTYSDEELRKLYANSSCISN